MIQFFTFRNVWEFLGISWEEKNTLFYKGNLGIRKLLYHPQLTLP